MHIFHIWLNYGDVHGTRIPPKDTTICFLHCVYRYQSGHQVSALVTLYSECRQPGLCDCVTKRRHALTTTTHPSPGFCTYLGQPVQWRHLRLTVPLSRRTPAPEDQWTSTRIHDSFNYNQITCEIITSNHLYLMCFILQPLFTQPFSQR